jgi:hypothetical protein
LLLLETPLLLKIKNGYSLKINLNINKMKNIKTKKIIGFFAMATVLLIVGCKEQPKEQPAVKTVEKEVIVVPAPAPVVIEKEVPAKKTTVTLDKNGVEVNTKNVEVKIE